MGSNFVGGDWQNGFGVRFAPQADGSFSATYVFDALKQGPPGIAHGGAIATLFDEAMTATALHNIDGMAFTINLNVNYHAPIFLGVEVTITSRITHIERRKIDMTAEMRLPDGTVASSATGLFIELKSPD